MSYRIVEENRQIWIERSSDGKSWASVKETNVPKYFDSVADARSWVATLRKGRVIHSVEDDGLKWFLDRVGKLIIRTKPVPKFDIELPFEITDEDHARHLHTASVEMGYVYTDAPNIAQDERKPDDGVKPLEWFLERVGKNVENRIGYLVTIYTEDMARTLYNCQLSGYYDHYSDPS